ncbi:MAG: 3',5'-cyclic-nucleotide phosphodiesterase [Bdellovibrionales bacterium]
MKIKALGASGGVAPGYQTTCYQIDDHLLVDCGAASSEMSVEAQASLTDILITHPHLDHIKDIAFIIENSFSASRPVLNLRSKSSVLDDVHRHLFNDVLWPDFSKIINNPKTKSNILNFQSFENQLELDGYKITMIDVNHPGNAVGFIIDDGVHQIVFSGDTGPTDELWEIANSQENLKAVFTEISFPNDMLPLAEASGHMTTKLLVQEIKTKLDSDVPLFINHFKPLYFSQLVKEFHELAPSNWTLLHQNHELNF